MLGLLPESLPAGKRQPRFSPRAVAGSLLTVLRNPIDRLRHAFYMHPHYKRKYGDGGGGFGSLLRTALGLGGSPSTTKPLLAAPLLPFPECCA